MDRICKYFNPKPRIVIHTAPRIGDHLRDILDRREVTHLIVGKFGADSVLKATSDRGFFRYETHYGATLNGNMDMNLSDIREIWNTYPWIRVLAQVNAEDIMERKVLNAIIPILRDNGFCGIDIAITKQVDREILVRQIRLVREMLPEPSLVTITIGAVDMIRGDVDDLMDLIDWANIEFFNCRGDMFGHANPEMVMNRLGNSDRFNLCLPMDRHHGINAPYLSDTIAKIRRLRCKWLSVHVTGYRYEDTDRCAGWIRRMNSATRAFIPF